MEVTDFAPVAGSGANNVDMMTLNETGPQAGRYMYRTHEVASNGAVTMTDLGAFKGSGFLNPFHSRNLTP